MPSKPSAEKSKPAPRKHAKRTARSRPSPADQRRFLAADIAAAALAGYREGAATALAQSVVSSQSAQPSKDIEKIEWPAPVKILADGTFCEPGDLRTDHVAVWLPAAGIVVHPVSLGTANGKELPNLDACIAACRELRVLDYSDWQLARREDWNHILDLTRHAPALDPNLYPGIKPEWHWTATGCAWADKDAAGRSASAWHVSAYDGSVGGYFLRSLSGFALAVRRVGQ